ncbi:hypothetical protein KY330_04350 [Candidatus Woesearchaeota archaeon]|nr:hypothetical protein [Candidatus Woesearchaeota archaeon]
MSEKKLVVDQLTFSYSGLFDIHELYSLIDSFLKEKGYDKYEKKNISQVTPSGKHMELELRPWKMISDYVKLWMKITVFMTNVKDVEIEKEGVKVKLNQGNIQIVFDGYIETDYENRWANNMIFVFFRTLVDKYVIKSYLRSFEGEVTEDIHQLFTEVKSFLNLYRY